MQRWIVLALGLVVWSCASKKAHPLPTTVSLDQRQVKLGRVFNLRVEHAPQGWSGQISVNNSKHLNIDPRNLSFATTSANGFPDRGIYSLVVALVDRGGYEIPVANQGALRLEVSPASVTIVPDADEASPTGSSGQIHISAADDYHWSAKGVPPWLQLTPASEGTGDAALEYTAAANTTQERRSAKIEIGDGILTITQPAPRVQSGKVSDLPDPAKPAPGSAKPTAQVTFSKDTIAFGEDLQINLDRLPARWTGELMVNAVRRFAFDSKTYRLQATLANGFRESGATDIYVLLLDSNGRQIPLANNGFYHVNVTPAK